MPAGGEVPRAFRIVEEEDAWRQDADPWVRLCHFHQLCQQIGLDTLAFSIPYMTSWAQSAELSVLECCAGLVDRICSRLEDVLLAQAPALAAAA